MTSPTIGSANLAKLAARTQSVRLTVTLKGVRQFRAYCCNIDSDGIMGVAKEPVIIANISPNPVCLGSAVSWDMTDSYAPGSTIASWDIDFGDGNSDTGPSIGTASGSHTYAAAGTYTITMVIEEGLGTPQTSTEQVTVMECGEPPLDWSYASTFGAGVFYIDWTDTVPAWVERNTGLSGNALFVNSMVLKPGDERKPPSRHELWIASRGGVFRTRNGGNSWDEVTMTDPSNLEFSDIPATDKNELDWVCVRYDPKEPNTVYVEARKI